MPLPLIPVGVGIGLVYLYKKAKNRGMTPERRQIFESARETLRDPVKLRLLADQYEREGLKDEAVELRQRAQLIELPPEQKVARRDAFRAALRSGDPDKVQQMAEVFKAQGATGSAVKLFAHAASLRELLASGVTETKVGDEMDEGNDFDEPRPERDPQEDRFVPLEERPEKQTKVEAEAAVAELNAEDEGDPVEEGGPLKESEQVVEVMPDNVTVHSA